MAVSEITFEKSTGYDDALARAASESGIDREYWDIFHHRHEVAAESIKRILSALGWDISSAEKIDEQRFRRFQENTASLLPNT